MRILFLSQRIPYPPDRGDRLRAFHIIKFLAQHHEVAVAALAQSPDELEQVQGLRDWTVATDVEVVTRKQSHAQYPSALLRSEPLTLAHFRSRRLWERAALRLDHCDVAFVYCSSMAPYVERSSLPKFIDFVDCDSSKWDDYARRASVFKRWIYRREGRVLQEYETEIAATFDHCFVTTDQELARFSQHADCDKFTTVSNGIDFSFFRRDSSAPREPHTIIFTGVMDYFANVDAVMHFARRVLPIIRREIPEAKFLIVGRDPVREVQCLARDSSIAVTGYVPDARPYLERASVSVSPLRIARGIQNKVLEAMAMELPVVATPRAATGIRGTAGEHFLVADDEDAMAKSVVRVLRDANLRNEMGRKARALIERDYDWNVCLRPIEDALQRVFERRRTDCAGRYVDVKARGT